MLISSICQLQGGQMICAKAEGARSKEKRSLLTDILFQTEALSSENISIYDVN